MLQYLALGIGSDFIWIFVGWFISNPIAEDEVDEAIFMKWLFIQQIIEIVPYDCFQVCWAAIAYIRYQSVKNGAFLDNNEYTKPIKTIQVSIDRFRLRNDLPYW